MLTISAFQEEQNNQSILNKTKTTDESENLNNASADQKEADDYIKQKIRVLLNREEEEQIELSELPISSISQRRTRKIFWKNIIMYLSAGGILTVHFAAVFIFRFCSYKFISNKEIMNFKRR